MNTMPMSVKKSCLAIALIGSTQFAFAADWSDTSIGYRYGSNFAEPYVGDDIGKSIYNVTHSSGYKYGTNFFNVDFLQSDAKNTNAQEAYLVYRHTLDFGKISGKDLSVGPIKSFGFTLGLDWNSKTGDSYNSRKRMYVAGPTIMFDVPKGFATASLLFLKESNLPKALADQGKSRYTYKTHPMLNVAWGLPIASSDFAFEGYLNWIAAKGKNEFGGATSAELNIDAMVMYDTSALFGMKPKSLRVGAGYQYWRNKFGNPKTVKGSEAKTPMVRVDYHF